MPQKQAFKPLHLPQNGSMKVLITGATGLVGKAIIKELHQRGIAVNYLTTRKEKLVSTKEFQGFLWDPAIGEIDYNCFEGVDTVINLAGASIAKRWTTAYKKEVLQSRLDSLETLKNAFQKIDTSQITSFVSASAIGIYPSSLYNFYDEKEKDVDNSFLGEVVEQWEQKIDEFGAFNFNVAKIRIGIVLSTLGGALPKMAKPIQNFVGAPFGSGNQWQSWIHIGDLAEMFIFVAKNNLEGTYNGVAPNPVTNAKMTKELARVLNRPLFLPNIPRFAMQAILGEMSYLLFASQRVSSKRIEKKGFIFQYANIGAAFDELYSTKKEDSESEMTAFNKEFV